MWIFLPDAFFSVVADRDDPERLLVRARVQGDIERYFPYCTPETTPWADYLFRVFLPRDEVAQVIADNILKMDYTNCREQIPAEDVRRSAAYSSVWSRMHLYQYQRLVNLEADRSDF